MATDSRAPAPVVLAPLMAFRLEALLEPSPRDRLQRDRSSTGEEESQMPRSRLGSLHPGGIAADVAGPAPRDGTADRTVGILRESDSPPCWSVDRRYDDSVVSSAHPGWFCDGDTVTVCARLSTNVGLQPTVCPARFPA